MRGFTLIELLLVLTIFSFIILIIFFLTINISNINTQIIFNVGKNREIIITVSALTKELRGMSQSNIGNYPIEKAQPNQIIFYSDIDKDNLIERIRYFVENNNLKKGIIKPTGNPLTYDPNNEIIYTMITDLTNTNIFSYYNRNNQIASDINSIKLIKINLSARGNNQSIINYSFTVAPRNLRFK